MAMSLNAPYGAPCFLAKERKSIVEQNQIRLNAPYGAPCFLTSQGDVNPFEVFGES